MLKKGLKTTITKPVQALAMDMIVAESKRFYLEIQSAEILKMAVEDVERAKDQEGRLDVASLVLESCMSNAMGESCISRKIAWVLACDLIWADFMAKYETIADAAQDEVLPSSYWVRHAFAHEHEAQIKIGNPIYIKIFKALGWDHPAKYLNPEKYEWDSGDGSRVGVCAIESYGEVA